jgi:endonuclease YncB( thermonuclease family)
MLLAAHLAHAAEIRGTAEVIDGDTLAIGAVRIRLHALHAPEMDELRGREAREAMRRIVGKKPVTCQAVDRDRYGRIVADCRNAEGRDLARAMIEEGVARHCPRYGRPDLEGLPTNGLDLPGYCR